MARTPPRYLKTNALFKLRAKAERATAQLANCTMCPRKCGVNRLSGETGYCRTGHNAVVTSYNAHFGEEAPLVGQHGSGTIFFTHCNLMCSFCQNYDISHHRTGSAVDDQDLAELMLILQKSGCHNINFVTPTHVMPQILSALCIAVEKGLTIPLVYNSSGYDRVSTLATLNGVIDIYMPDFKFWDPIIAKKTCQAADYPQVAQRAILEMHNQVGDLTMDAEGLAYKGLLVRHLVLPENLAGTSQVMAFLASKISKSTYVNIMHQYHPCGKASKMPPLNRSITNDEFKAALVQTHDAGITRIDKPGHSFISI